ncbi:hypothetical protein E4P40_12580 [Blastococcus sp. CT_GayMR20]|uniref:hypothetical protein n=1 Tax=Blastococcus sp. CT_GayMR20 TaxID=2559609 RepID=UPI0010741843|nr:hypothetical protein [Blastococcus sp. CT_GayMR20]TFV86670.1 hypothetical protein E4P40_12580 [Blastococcus sp. CT_GayMR20]
MELASFLRPVALLAGPAAVVAAVLLAVALVTVGDGELLTSPMVLASSSALLIALLGVGAAALAALARLQVEGRGAAGPAIAAVGSVLVAGGTWATLFVQPAIAAKAPDVLEAGLPSVVVGYAASYAVFCVGWIWTGVALVRARIVPTWLGMMLAVTGALAIVPGPSAFRLLLLSVVATLVARRLVAAVPGANPAPVAA